MNKYAGKEVRKPGGPRFAALGLFLVFLGSVALAHPQPWNDAMRAMDAKTGYHLPYLPDTPFTLGLDLQGGAHLLYEADMSSIPEADRVDALAGVRDVIERRVNAFGVAEPVVQTNIADGKYRVLVDLPGVSNVEEAVKQIGETPVLTFRVPVESIDTDPTDEQSAQIEASQKQERTVALTILDRAKDGADFAALAKEVSIDASTKDKGGVLGFLREDDPEYGGLIRRIEDDGLRRGIIDGLYEGTSRIHVMNYVSRRTETDPKLKHLLICYTGATSCDQTRTKEEALALVSELKKKATSRNFANLAKENSDDTSNKAEGGELGYATPGMFVKPFEDAAFAMKNGQISEPIETQFGYHLIFRESSRKVNAYELAHIELPWTTFTDIMQIDPWKNTALSGKDVRRASVAFDPNSGAPYIVLDFNSEGATLFGELTQANVGKVIGIFLDGQPVTTPVVQQPIFGGQASITGNFTLEEAKLMAQRLNAGALPVPISVVSQQTIGAALGEVSLAKSVQAGAVGFVLVGLFMVLYYRLPGVLAVLSLAFYAAVNLALFKMFNVTMTLSGIAGFVFSFGIAVDANVLVFERLKEELRSGRDLPSAIEEAFSRAWPSIRDGNITTLIATGVLYSMSTGFIRGFALTLTIGVLASMFSAMIVTRTMMRLIARVSVFRSKVFFLGYPNSK